MKARSEQGDDQRLQGAPHREIRLAPRLAKVIVTVVFCGFALVDIIRFVGSTPRAQGVWIIVGGVLIVVLLLMQLLHFGRASSRRDPRRRLTMLFLQAALVYLPFHWLGPGWLAMPSFVASNALLVLTPGPAWTIFSVVIVGDVALQAIYDASALSLAYVATSTVITALVVYGLTRMSELVTEVYHSRIALAQMAVEQERVRFARDLHDLLGYSLSTIALKTELAHRLGKENWERTNEELLDVLRISRQALADVREVSSGYRRMSLEDELRAAESILAAAEIEPTVTADSLDFSALSERAGTVLATVLREGITNLLRHSDARHCTISLGHEGASDDGVVRLSLRNDGVRAEPLEEAGASGRAGTGILNLTTRVEALGGRLVAGVGRDGWFHLDAEVRTRPPGPAGAAPDR
ncbi:sensor histidine kinase [Sphaerisporangium fuscum]|uniref:sensor histidine kinase n=1 Tax=Sphaerisporangium fuscum TaxID=2835868 RepID=UPI001BDC4A79|nr:histidine kinase [Sphaerisporangium fuscum]